MKSSVKVRFSLFWALQSIAWTAYGLISFGGALPYVGTVPHLNSVRSLLANRLAFVVMGLLSTGLLRIAYRHARHRARSL